MKTLQDYIDKLNKLNFKEMYENDFFLTWEKTDEELEQVQGEFLTLLKELTSTDDKIMASLNDLIGKMEG